MTARLPIGRRCAVRFMMPNIRALGQHWVSPGNLQFCALSGRIWCVAEAGGSYSGIPACTITPPSNPAFSAAAPGEAALACAGHQVQRTQSDGERGDFPGRFTLAGQGGQKISLQLGSVVFAGQAGNGVANLRVGERLVCGELSNQGVQHVAQSKEAGQGGEGGSGPGDSAGRISVSERSKTRRKYRAGGGESLARIRLP